MRKFLFIYFLTLSQITWAQLNESDTLLIQSRFSLTGNWQTGNVEFLALRSRLDMSIAPNTKFAFKTQNAYLYQEFYRRKADEDIFSRNFVYYNQTKRIYPFAMAHFTTNFRRGIDFRYFVGAGLTWQILRHKNHLIKTALSGVYEQSDFAQNTFNKSEYTGNNFISTWRSTIWLFGRHYFLKRKMFFHYEAYLQPSLEKSNNLRWQTEVGLDIPIWQGLSFTTNYIYTFESVVVERAKSNDAILTFGLAYQFKK